MKQLFAGLPCEIVVDDILIWGQTHEQHDDRLRQVLNKIRAINMKLNPDKCKFRVNSVQYVGHLPTADGPEKTKAVFDMPTHQDKHALQQFLGMTNYLSKFILQYSDITGPLRQLIHQDVEWYWHETQEEAFERLKQALTNHQFCSILIRPYQWSSQQTPLNMALVQYAYSEDGLYHLHHEPSHPLNHATLRSKKKCWHSCLQQENAMTSSTAAQSL